MEKIEILGDNINLDNTSTTLNLENIGDNVIFSEPSSTITSRASIKYVNIDKPEEYYFYWNPLPDITPYELAMCIPYINRIVRASELDQNIDASYFRHFNRVKR